MNHQEALTAYIAAFVAELVNTGIKDVVVSPGSRSTPMALVMAEHPGLNVHIQVDERSAAFFALGIAKSTGKPVALLCTSGTAAANYYPAIIEAYYSRVPLIVLTADRPHELRDVGAPQAIDQIHLYGKHVKWFVEMALPENNVEMIRYARTVCARAAATASMAPSGPVHLNFPFREPLIPNLQKEGLFEFQDRDKSYVNINIGHLELNQYEAENLADLLNSCNNGIIVCGAIDHPGFAEAVTRLAKHLNFPILADPLSQLRSGKHDGVNIIDCYDTFLRNGDAKNELRPEVIIRFGAIPVSKALTIFLKENHEVHQFVVDGGAGWRDPSVLSTHMIYADETLFCEKMVALTSEKGASPYLEKWKKANLITAEQLQSVRDITDMSESKLFVQLNDLLPENATLFVSNSMPIRDLDTFFHINRKNIKVMANRGVNGIDGIISTALGASLYAQPLFLVVGDLTFFHDMNGLLAAKLYKLDITIILINNNGGGIFSFLPQSEHPAHFELLFGTPLGIEFEHVVKMYKGTHEKITDWEHFAASLKKLSKESGLKVLEIVTNRDSNLEQHRELWNSVSREISLWTHGGCR
ncbi:MULTISPECIES: 2-succinyl-5-enolpyruvyl-6-hydroxy-3-cyclohexene-1-carboxylic-acid synthase [unclassified Bacillus (in: firmicutes)]|uniref:2-succinyl-5-enolpyruvyl-6-hydroxy-3- cyclohexene-1-carboxylic-acid synthase n=1 Tax=unclassified Bacillus (in: firmicutes) TaxID=185979 RepID=UPI0008E366BF|nr:MULTISPECIES: 2-succinyl-5-enolpyruvyl-6-hydroxy-3-cyclohexene-1-carboxylic-acid synthase [unclassified Bacillus (in: firmicutes)]SFB18481.1 2-succinyl-5-enolpyruvyl-6-hydroxy-3-cyclohexene-1-carboxylate synthase [Bacillus sp. UNCCL13]SFQ75953.1 2-succinyl-5-enolpyruvyl-6-hydroxy-3-cyclohexene-1-carboxylate synthase [Bacillus sp. cl95]